MFKLEYKARCEFWFSGNNAKIFLVCLITRMLEQCAYKNDTVIRNVKGNVKKKAECFLLAKSTTFGRLCSQSTKCTLSIFNAE
jgi:hypothetical protein